MVGGGGGGATVGIGGGAVVMMDGIGCGAAGGAGVTADGVSVIALGAFSALAGAASPNDCRQWLQIVCSGEKYSSAPQWGQVIVCSEASIADTSRRCSSSPSQK